MANRRHGGQRRLRQPDHNFSVKSIVRATVANTAPPYDDRVVAFVDILGFRNLVLSLRDNPLILSKVYRVLDRIKDVERSRQHSHSMVTELEVSVFSDSIAISSPSQDEKAFSLCWTCGYLQASLLYLGILSRGGIAIGPTIHTDGILVGEGLISAYDLEQGVAHFPRIVLSKAAFEKHQRYFRPFSAVDGDGVRFLDLFKFDDAVEGIESLAGEGYDPRAIFYEEVRKHLVRGLIDTHNEGHAAKYAWLARRYDLAVSEFNQKALHKVDPIQASG